MTEPKKSPFSLSIEDLAQELMARSIQTTPDLLSQFPDTEGITSRNAIMRNVQKKHQSLRACNPDLSGVGTSDIAKILIFKTQPGLDATRGSATIQIHDYFDILDFNILHNAQSIAVLCHKDDLENTGIDSFRLKTQNYAQTFNLCEYEPFRTQPVSIGSIATAFPVSDSIMATSAHYLNEKNIADLRFVFGYFMTSISTPFLSFSSEEIYHADEVIGNDLYSLNGWAFLRLDRTITPHRKVMLSTESVTMDQDIYLIGHPIGLPLKLATGATIDEMDTNGFKAGLSFYAGHIGSPVFDLNTHRVIGMVTDPAPPDFIWTGNGWLSFKNPEKEKTLCAPIPEKINKLLASGS